MGPLARQYAPEQISHLRGIVRARILSESPYARQANFIKLADRDLLLLYRLYDEHFFAGEVQPLVMNRCGVPVEFRVSRAMTSAGGKTITRRHRKPSGIAGTHYEIAVSTSLLFNSFTQDSRPVIIAGQLCPDRLDALMRIMEHELIHLLELLTFGNSSCSRTRFLTFAQRLFGHMHAKHQLVTAREHAATCHQVRVGQKVRFTHKGEELEGFVNRVGLRATVLVADPRGNRYSDGGIYVKFLVPPAWLTPSPA